MITFQWPAPMIEELEAVRAWQGKARLDWCATPETIVESGDAPPEVLAWLRRCIAAQEKWDAGALDRPVEHKPLQDHVRFFGGEWLPRWPYVLGTEATLAGLTHAVSPVTIIEGLAASGHVDDARRVAGAVYELVRVERDARAALVSLCLDMDRGADE